MADFADPTAAALALDPLPATARNRVTPALPAGEQLLQANLSPQVVAEIHSA